MDGKINPSIWEKQTFYKPQQVIVVGSGIVGLTAAYFLKQRDKTINITVIERGAIPSGASTKNAGFACFGSISELLSDQHEHAIDAVKELIRMRESGLRRLREIVPDNAMDYNHYGGFEYFSSSQENLFQLCEANIDFYNSVVKEVTGLTETFSTVPAARFGFHSSLPLIYNKHEGQLHPAKMISYLKKILITVGVNFLNGLLVQNITETNHEVLVNVGKGLQLRSEKIIIATNAFSAAMADVPDLKAVRNQVYLTEEIQNLKAIGCFHSEEGYVYFRNVGNRILIGGARQHFDTEDTDQLGQTDTIKKYLLDFVHHELAVDSSISFDHEWSGILAVGDSKTPIIKRISPRQIIGVRMGGMGIAIGSKVGEKLADLTYS